jgi:membrane peptidoglycan carboxypeptidase
VATAELAQEVGYQIIVAVAHGIGLNKGIHPTPAVVVAAYETTLIEAAAAYSAFARLCVRVSHAPVSMVRAVTGDAVYGPNTGATARSHRFTLPAPAGPKCRETSGSPDQ